MANRSTAVKTTGPVTTRASGAKGKSQKTAANASRAKDPQETTEITCGNMPNFIGYDLRRASLLMNSMANSALAQVQMRTTWVSVLEVICKNPGLKQSRIAEVLDIKKANLVSILNSLEQRGAIRRLPDPADRRAYSLHLTASGRLLLKQSKKVGTENEQVVIDRFGKENHTQLIHLLCLLREEFAKTVRPVGDDDV